MPINPFSNLLEELAIASNLRKPDAMTRIGRAPIFFSDDTFPVNGDPALGSFDSSTGAIRVARGRKGKKRSQKDIDETIRHEDLHNLFNRRDKRFLQSVFDTRPGVDRLDDEEFKKQLGFFEHNLINKLLKGKSQEAFQRMEQRTQKLDDGIIDLIQRLIGVGAQ